MFTHNPDAHETEVNHRRREFARHAEAEAMAVQACPQSGWVSWSQRSRLILMHLRVLRAPWVPLPAAWGIAERRNVSTT